MLLLKKPCYMATKTQCYHYNIVSKTQSKTNWVIWSIKNKYSQLHQRLRLLRTGVCPQPADKAVYFECYHALFVCLWYATGQRATCSHNKHADKINCADMENVGKVHRDTADSKQLLSNNFERALFSDNELCPNIYYKMGSKTSVVEFVSSFITIIFCPVVSKCYV